MDAMDARKDDAEHVLKVTKKCEDEVIEVRVSDTGVGMSQEVCRRE